MWVLHPFFGVLVLLFSSFPPGNFGDISQLGLLPPHVSSIPSTSGSGDGTGRDPGDDCQSRRYKGECVELVNNMEFKPFITYEHLRYSVMDPQIKNEIVPNPKPFDVRVKIPQPFVTKVPVQHINEKPVVKRLKKIREVIEHVPVQNTNIVREKVEIPDPVVIQQKITIQDVQRTERRRVIRRPVRKIKKIQVEEFREITIPKFINRVIIHRRPKYVNVTNVEIIKKRVEVPKIIYKTLRVPKAVIKPGEEVEEVKTQVKKVPSSYTEQEVEWKPQSIPRDVIQKEPKEIKVPYAQPTRIVRPIPFPVPVIIPEKEMYDVPKHIAEPVNLPVPCGYNIGPKLNDEYLPAQCPPCPKCEQCEECQGVENHHQLHNIHNNDGLDYPGSRRLKRGIIDLSSSQTIAEALKAINFFKSSREISTSTSTTTSTSTSTTTTTTAKPTIPTIRTTTTTTETTSTTASVIDDEREEEEDFVLENATEKNSEKEIEDKSESETESESENENENESQSEEESENFNDVKPNSTVFQITSVVIDFF